jgi:hypothetical protein
MKWGRFQMIQNPGNGSRLEFTIALENSLREDIGQEPFDLRH